MKKFNFIINYINGNFTGMAGDRKNIDSYLDDKLKNSLSGNVSPDFTIEVMKRVEIEKEFTKEDIKTDRIVKYIIGGVVCLLAIITTIFGIVLKSSEEGVDAGFLSRIIDRFSNSIEYISMFTTENLGFTFDLKTTVIIFFIMLCIFLFSFADRIIFKKSYK